MEIINFSNSIRVGGGFPACLDIEKIGGHEEDGIFATFTDAVGKSELPRVELRRRGFNYALFLFRYDDMELPEYWKDSEVVWELPPKEKTDA